MSDNAVHDSASPESKSPLRENWLGSLFMVLLLIVSGATATVVGYKIKSADRQRKADLLAAYESLGGSFAKSLTLTETVFSPSLNEQQQLFVATYELNERARKIGLYQVLETMQPQEVEAAIKGLLLMDSKEGGLSLRDAWMAYQESGSAGKAMNPTAARFAKQYDRYIARDTETKLYKYLVDHQGEIVRK